MKLRPFPYLATIAALALAVVAPAQDRGRRSGGGDRGGRQERSAPSRSGGDRSFPSRGGDSRPSFPDRGRPSRDGVPDRPARDSRPDTSGSSRTDRTNPFGRGGSPDRTNRDSRPNNPDSRPGRDNPFSRDNRNRDSRPNNGPDSRPDRGNPPSRDNDRNRDSRPWNSGSRGNDRRNPFDRDSRGGWNGSRPGGPSRNWTPRSHDYRAPSRYDGRGRIDARRYGAPPSRVSLSVQIGRTGIRTGSRFAFGADFGGLRIGFVSYGGGYRRGGFGYSHYFYDPYDYACVASPWYRYSYLPPYLDRTRVIVVNNYPSTWGWDGWSTYDYRSDRNDRRDEAVQDALDDLRNAFERQDEQNANRLVPQSGDVAIFNEGKYDYSLNPEDFQGMFLDGVEQSKTLSYEILEVRRQGDEVRVRARHEYEDSWGARQSTIHTLTLRREGGGYVIREFGSE